MSKTKVYVAGASEELARAEAAMRFLEEAGLEVTYDWTVDVRRNGSGNPPDATDSQRSYWAHADLFGIDDADIVLFLGGGPRRSDGLFFEAGYAYRGKQETHWAGGCPSIFCVLLDHRHKDDQSALRHIATQYGTQLQAASDYRP